MNREIKPINVSRWPWHGEVIHWTWRDSQEHHYNSLRAKRNRGRLVALCMLVILAGLFSGLVRWITL
jgi:phage terminase large subunit-like protein